MSVDNLLDSAGDLIKTAPQIYEDGLRDTVKESGKFLARIPRAINAALSGLDIWIAKREFNVEETKRILAEKLEHVDPEKIVPPDPHIAVPAMQAIAYSMDSNELRNMYANLLAKAMNSDLKDTVRAAFVEVIKQMEPIDAINLSLFRDEIDGLPVAQYQKVVVTRLDNDDDSIYISHIANDGDNYYILQTNVFISNPDNLDIESQAISISSLERLGLITILWDTSVSDYDYAVFKETNMYRSLIKQVQPVPSDGYQFPRDIGICKEIRIFQGQALLTPFGLAFLNVCL